MDWFEPPNVRPILVTVVYLWIRLGSASEEAANGNFSNQESANVLMGLIQRGNHKVDSESHGVESPLSLPPYGLIRLFSTSRRGLDFVTLHISSSNWALQRWSSPRVRAHNSFRHRNDRVGSPSLPCTFSTPCYQLLLVKPTLSALSRISRIFFVDAG